MFVRDGKNLINLKNIAYITPGFHDEGSIVVMNGSDGPVNYHRTNSDSLYVMSNKTVEEWHVFLALHSTLKDFS